MPCLGDGSIHACMARLNVQQALPFCGTHFDRPVLQ